MATTNNFTFGVDVHPFTLNFPFIDEDNLVVTLDGVVKTLDTDYTVINKTSNTAAGVGFLSGARIQFTADPLPSSGAVKVVRDTNLETTSTFKTGSAIRAVDLNSNFLQTLYVSQEVVDEVDGTVIDVSTAVQAAQDAETAASNAETAANNAISVANTANTTADTANTTANTANTTANTANNTANTALNNATAAVTAANNAVTTANTAVTTADGAVTTADAAAHDATVALNLVSAVVDFPIVANVAAIPSSPANDEGVEILDTTGIESFTPLTGVPVGFTGSADLRAKIRYNATGSTWEWISYTAVDPESRYVNSTNGVISTSLGVGTSSPSTALEVAVSNSTILSTSTGNSSGKLAVNSNRAAGLIGGQLVSKWNDNDVARIDFYNGADGTNKDDGAIGIATSNNSSSPQTRVYVAQDGKVGIGTSNPGQILEVANGDNPAIELNNSNTDNSTSRSARLALNIGNTLAAGIRTQTGVGEDASGAVLGFSTGGDATFSKMRIIANGNVGIGTTSPANLLHVKTTSTSPETVAGFGNGSIDVGLEVTTDGDLAWGLNAFNSRNLTFSTNQQERARVTSDGKLGIGTTNPQQTLDVSGNANIGATTGNAFIEVGQGATEDRFAYIDLIADTTYTDYGLRLIRENQGANATSKLTHRGTGDLRITTEEAADIAFVTDSTERMRINSDGTTVFSGPVTLPAGSTVAGYRATFNHITATANTPINDHQWVSVLNPGTTITLPANPTDGMEVRISVGNFTNTVVARNGANIMNAAADLTIDVAYKTVTLIYDGLTVVPAPVFGWRII